MPLSRDPEARARSLANLRRGRGSAPSPLDEAKGTGTARVPAPTPAPPESQPGHPTLRKGSLPGTGQGNANRVRTGLKTRSPGARFLEPVVAELRQAVQDANVGYSPADEPALRAVGIQQLIVDRTAAYLMEHGTVDPDTGQLRPELDAIGKAAERLLKMLGEVGLTMSGRARLGVDVTRARLAAAAEADLEASRKLIAERMRAVPDAS